jgi:hypothetical protein
MENNEEVPLLSNHEEEQKNLDNKGLRCMACTILLVHSLVQILQFLWPVLRDVYVVFLFLDQFFPETLKNIGLKQ